MIVSLKFTEPDGPRSPESIKCNEIDDAELGITAQSFHPGDGFTVLQRFL